MTQRPASSFTARLAQNADDFAAAEALRFDCFRTGRGLGGAASDADDHDRHCEHMLIEERRTGVLVCCFRVLPLSSGAEIGRAYSARHYDLSRLSVYDQPMMEMGRFCVHPDWRLNPGVIRAAWAALAALVEERGVQMLFGCSSFEGAEAEIYRDSFALLNEKHLAPKRWLPRIKAPKTFPFARLLRKSRPDMKAAAARMPPLLRFYLLLGGWVSDHAVIDDDLNTLHVFTGLELSRTPKSRLRALTGV